MYDRYDRRRRGPIGPRRGGRRGGSRSGRDGGRVAPRRPRPDERGVPRHPAGEHRGHGKAGRDRSSARAREGAGTAGDRRGRCRERGAGRTDGRAGRGGRGVRRGTRRPVRRRRLPPALARREGRVRERRPEDPQGERSAGVDDRRALARVGGNRHRRSPHDSDPGFESVSAVREPETCRSARGGRLEQLSCGTV